jgi:hypothetical protein
LRAGCARAGRSRGHALAQALALLAEATITADGHTYEVTDLHIDGSTATAQTQGGRTLTFHKVGTGWTLAK